MNESSGDPSLIGRIARRFRIRAGGGDDTLSPNSRSNHDHNYSLPISNSAVRKNDSGSDISGQPSHGDGQYSTATAKATAPVSPTTSTKTDTNNEEKTASVEIAVKGPIITRIYHTLRLIILSSWINWALVFVPLGITLGAMHRSMGHESPISPTLVFSINAVAIVPLASLLSFATENVARNLGDKVGALLNVTFGNAVELIILIALVAKEVRIVQASLLGSILANLLLILGMCFLFGGLRYREQLYNSNITQMSAALLSLSVMSLLLPTAFHASFSNLDTADAVVLKVSRGTSVILLLVYLLYLLFQLKSHAYFYESTPQHKIDEESHPGVLADMLNSSSSSESSSSSDSDSDTTSASNTRTKRIKQALKKRRRRKHTINSKEARQSFSSASVNQTYSPSSHPTPLISSRTNQHPTFSSVSLQPEVIVNEVGTDERDNIRGDLRFQPVSKDFADDQGSAHRQKVTTTCHHQNKGKKRIDTIDNPVNKTVEQKVRAASDSTRSTHRKQHVNFAADNVNSSEPEVVKRPFNVRSLSTRQVLPRGFTNSPYIYPTQTTPTAPSRSQCNSHDNEHGLRRANSLPGRLRSPLNQSIILSVQPLPHLMAAAPSQSPDGIEAETRGSLHLSRTASVILLVISTALVAVCAEFLVSSIDYLVENTGVSQAFIGLIILPIVGNAAEHITAVVVASKNKMDLAIGVALGSSIQIALFVTPIIVLLGWCLDTEMSLYFSLFETISLFASAFIVNYLVLDGRTNYLEGALLISAYVIIALAAFFYPSCENLSSASGSHDAGSC
ncbi:calcium/proton exchanger [Emergomyces pasteurianus Ep9510]|uniref:Calcium/proton exchanger n=1 Tax=Emergomyces pasteurianus Ep9510 TaxID=1447872 RepID=A0A1J9QPU9_9EURO|nr:calcium/proton exchanger [Emergomyces pasteurianus Ep9510]